MNTLDAKTLDELAELERRATVGPWNRNGDRVESLRKEIILVNRASPHLPDVFRIADDHVFNAELIIALRNHATTLIVLARRGLAAENMATLLREATMTFGHSHWDKTMSHGAGCSLCMEQAKVSNKIATALSDFGREVGNGK